MVALVLLGAGASFGSGEAIPYPPPLGNGDNGLFAKLEERGRVAASLPEALRELFRRDFEAGMATYFADYGGDTMAFQRQLAEYLAHFRPGPGNLYGELLQRLGIQRVVYSSLNYDLLLESCALRLFGADRVYYGVDDQRGGMCRLLKPHGSSNFWPSNRAVRLTNSTFRNNNGMAEIEMPIEALSPDATLERCRTDDSLAPSMCLYAAGKPARVAYVSTVKLQQDMWKETVALAGQIFVSGVRVHPVDEHLWKPLAEAPGQLTYFGLAGDRSLFDEWKEACGRPDAYFVEANFADAIAHMERRLRRC